MLAYYLPCDAWQTEHLRHCEAVIALVADEHFAVAPDEQLRQWMAFSKAVALQVVEHAVDPRSVLLQQPFKRRLAADRLFLDPAGVSVAEQVRLFPTPAVPVALDDCSVLHRGG